MHEEMNELDLDAQTEEMDSDNNLKKKRDISVKVLIVLFVIALLAVVIFRNQIMAAIDSMFPKICMLSWESLQPEERASEGQMMMQG